jgi:hypothetical protein
MLFTVGVPSKRIILPVGPVRPSVMTVDNIGFTENPGLTQTEGRNQVGTLKLIDTKLKP